MFQLLSSFGFAYVVLPSRIPTVYPTRGMGLMLFLCARLLWMRVEGAGGWFWAFLAPGTARRDRQMLREDRTASKCL